MSIIIVIIQGIQSFIIIFNHSYKNNNLIVKYQIQASYIVNYCKILIIIVLYLICIILNVIFE